MRQDWSNNLRLVLILRARFLLGSQSRLVDSRDLSGFIMLLFQAALSEEKSKTESPGVAKTESQGVKKSTKSVDESSKKRKHSDEVLIVSPVPPPQVVGVPSIVTPGLMLVPKGELKISPSTPIPQFPKGFTLTRVDPEEPDHQDGTPQVKYLGSFSDFLLTFSFSGAQVPV